MKISELEQFYRDEVVKSLQKSGKYKNINEIPKLEKIVVTTHVGRYQADRKVAVEDAINDLVKITGQKPSTVYAKKSVSNFKVREGEAVGARVTLRSRMMWEFLDRFINITAPSIRDFRGFSYKSFDGRGNYAVGISEQSIFPEIELDQIKRNLGFDIIIVTTASNNEDAKQLLDELKFPFRQIQEKEEVAA